MSHNHNTFFNRWPFTDNYPLNHEADMTDMIRNYSETCTTGICRCIFIVTKSPLTTGFIHQCTVKGIDYHFLFIFMVSNIQMSIHKLMVTLTIPQTMESLKIRDEIVPSQSLVDRYVRIFSSPYVMFLRSQIRELRNIEIKLETLQWI